MAGFSFLKKSIKPNPLHFRYLSRLPLPYSVLPLPSPARKPGEHRAFLGVARHYSVRDTRERIYRILHVNTDYCRIRHRHLLSDQSFSSS